jgi:hypothetical protein
MLPIDSYSFGGEMGFAGSGARSRRRRARQISIATMTPTIKSAAPMPPTTNPINAALLRVLSDVAGIGELPVVGRALLLIDVVGMVDSKLIGVVKVVLSKLLLVCGIALVVGCCIMITLESQSRPLQTHIGVILGLVQT